jgi:hypothetical protein
MVFHLFVVLTDFGFNLLELLDNLRFVVIPLEPSQHVSLLLQIQLNISSLALDLVDLV